MKLNKFSYTFQVQHILHLIFTLLIPLNFSLNASELKEAAEIPTEIETPSSCKKLKTFDPGIFDNIPPEIIILIFEKLTHPLDGRSLLFSCKGFYTNFFWLFPDVFGSYFYKEKSERENIKQEDILNVIGVYPNFIKEPMKIYLALENVRKSKWFNKKLAEPFFEKIAKNLADCIIEKQNNFYDIRLARQPVSLDQDLLAHWKQRKREYRELLNWTLAKIIWIKALYSTEKIAQTQTKNDREKKDPTNSAEFIKVFENLIEAAKHQKCGSELVFVLATNSSLSETLTKKLSFTPNDAEIHDLTCEAINRGLIGAPEIHVQFNNLRKSLAFLKAMWRNFDRIKDHEVIDLSLLLAAFIDAKMTKEACICLKKIEKNSDIQLKTYKNLTKLCIEDKKYKQATSFLAKASRKQNDKKKREKIKFLKAQLHLELGEEKTAKNCLGKITSYHLGKLYIKFYKHNILGRIHDRAYLIKAYDIFQKMSEEPENQKNWDLYYKLYELAGQLNYREAALFYLQKWEHLLKQDTSTMTIKDWQNLSYIYRKEIEKSPNESVYYATLANRYNCAKRIYNPSYFHEMRNWAFSLMQYHFKKAHIDPESQKSATLWYFEVHNLLKIAIQDAEDFNFRENFLNVLCSMHHSTQFKSFSSFWSDKAFHLADELKNRVGNNPRYTHIKDLYQKLLLIKLQGPYF